MCGFSIFSRPFPKETFFKHCTLLALLLKIEMKVVRSQVESGFPWNPDVWRRNINSLSKIRNTHGKPSHSLGPEPWRNCDFIPRTHLFLPKGHGHQYPGRSALHLCGHGHQYPGRPSVRPWSSVPRPFCAPSMLSLSFYVCSLCATASLAPSWFDYIVQYL